MWQSRLLNGTTEASIFINAEWEIIKTPKQWWSDYAIAHPGYDPYALDEESGMQIYGSEFAWGKEEYENIKTEIY